MSSQPDGGVPLSIAHSQQNVRLLELPPALLELLTSPDPPTIEIKSSAPPLSPTTPSSTPSANAVLCTPTQTFQIRQVQTSNSVFLTGPYLPPSSSTSTNTQSPPNASFSSYPPPEPQPGIRAVATCAHTLELLPQPASLATAKWHLAQHLPTWSGPESDSLLTATTSSPSNLTRAAVFASIPLSPAECHNAWTALCAFEEAAQGRCWLPTAGARLGAWRAVLRGLVARGLDMRGVCAGWEAGKRVGIGGLVGEIEEEEGWMAGLVKAVVGRVGKVEGGGQEEDEIWVDSAKLVPWTGETLLEAKTHNSEAIAIVEFMQEWRDCLPESWAEKTSLDVIQGRFAQPSSSTIRYVRDVQPSDSAPGSLASSKPTNRKWHEKFKQSRK
ncbi:MAG: hypothetical protein M1821_000433 [Bathelium mastoideum]|nr:MAG: hypothetical protein M1821_000433 [Bathelium mastoideum]